MFCSVATRASLVFLIYYIRYSISQRLFGGGKSSKHCTSAFLRAFTVLVVTLVFPGTV